MIVELSFFAIHFGLGQAGIFKLVSNISGCIVLGMQKVFGQTSYALLAHNKNMNIEKKREAFLTITGSIHTALYSIIVFFAINYKKIVLINSIDYLETKWHLVLLFFIINISEYFFLAFEKLFIVEEKTEYIFLFTLINIVSMYYL